MHQEYRLLGQGVRQRRLYCRQCQAPLPFEPDVFRRILSRGGTPEAAWLVRRCRNPICGASHLQAPEDASDIEYANDGIWQEQGAGLDEVK
jgi:hypothetical protein